MGLCRRWTRVKAGEEMDMDETDETHAQAPAEHDEMWEHIRSLNEPTEPEGGPVEAGGRVLKMETQLRNLGRTRTCTWRT